jgi:hypothetical protein
MSVLWQFKSGRPFTPEADYPGLELGINEDPETNSRRMPATSTVDIGFDKNFQAYGMNYTFTMLIANVFDFKNVDEVHESTGLANTNVNYNRQIITGQPIDKDPVMYTQGRQISFGLKVNF